MTSPIIRKFHLWSDSNKGFKSGLSNELNSPSIDRDDIAGPVVRQKIRRGDVVQRLRLQYYPSIDVNRDNLFAGYIEGDLSDAKEILHEMGYRNNPTAYVEVTDEHGPDDGSFAKQIVTESGAGSSRQFLHNHPTVFRREKRQIHICTFVVDGRVEFLAHEEISAWLQPVRHVTINEAKGRIGVRDFRDDWFDAFDEELDGKDQVNWQTTN